jgi:hypothetical protein
VRGPVIFKWGNLRGRCAQEWAAQAVEQVQDLYAEAHYEHAQAQTAGASAVSAPVGAASQPQPETPAAAVDSHEAATPQRRQATKPSTKPKTPS